MIEKPVEAPVSQLVILKRRVFLAALVAGEVAMLIGLLSGQASRSAYDAIVMPALAITFLVLIVVLWRLPHSQGFVEIVLFSAATISILGKLISLELTSTSSSARMAEYNELFYWFPLIYLLAFFIFENRLKMFVASLLFFLGVVAIGHLSLSSDWDLAGTRSETFFLLRFYLANLAYIFLLGLSTRLNDQYIRLRMVAEEMTGLANTDSLLQIANRRDLELEIPRAISKAARYNQPLAAIMFDLDRFKQINDTYGHLTGDAVLKHVATIVKSIVRGSDLFGRWGGDEFLILLPQTNEMNAQKLAKRMQEAVSSSRLEPVDSISASFGAAEFHYGETQQEWLRRVDGAMYAAKAQVNNP